MSNYLRLLFTDLFSHGGSITIKSNLFPSVGEISSFIKQRQAGKRLLCSPSRNALSHSRSIYNDRFREGWSYLCHNDQLFYSFHFPCKRSYHNHAVATVGRHLSNFSQLAAVHTSYSDVLSQHCTHSEPEVVSL